MSVKTLANLARSVRQTLVQIAWRQWAAIGASATTDEQAKSIVDPEALLLVSLSLKDDERRLWDVMAGWAEHWSRLLSVQRTRNIAEAYGEDARTALEEFATFAFVEASDARWKKLAGKNQPVGPRKRLIETPRLVDDAALILRLRLGLGVGMRADILSFLMAQQDKPNTVRRIASVLSYTEPATRRALDDLVATGMLRATKHERPVRYAMEGDAWRQLLQLREPVPAWHYWHQVFSLLVAVITWERSSRGKTISAFALDALGWEIVESHVTAFTLNGLPVRSGTDTRPSFTETIVEMCGWITDHV